MNRVLFAYSLSDTASMLVKKFLWNKRLMYAFMSAELPKSQRFSNSLLGTTSKFRKWKFEFRLVIKLRFLYRGENIVNQLINMLKLP